MSLIRSSSLTFSLLKPAERLLSAPMPRSHELVCCCSRFTTDLVSPLLGYVSKQYKIFGGNNAQDKQQVFCHQHLMCSEKVGDITLWDLTTTYYIYSLYTYSNWFEKKSSLLRFSIWMKLTSWRSWTWQVVVHWDLGDNQALVPLHLLGFQEWFWWW